MQDGQSADEGTAPPVTATPAGLDASRGDAALPLIDAGRADPVERRRGALHLGLAAVALLFVGGVASLYFQGPGVRAFFSVTGLEPGGGARKPIARPVRPPVGGQADGPTSTRPRPAALPHEVVALGRLTPKGEAIAVGLPFGAGDARLAELLVEEGEAVEAGQLLARLDSLPPLQAAVRSAEARVSAASASLRQARSYVKVGRVEARAALERAEAAAAAAQADLTRARGLHSKGAIPAADLDRATSTARQAASEVDRLRATVSRYDEGGAAAADVGLAVSNLKVARAELDRAKEELRRGQVIAPAAGTVLAIKARPGERPAHGGILTLGDLREMWAELEVYESSIARVAVGQSVSLTGAPMSTPLVGEVASIGLEVGRQQLTSDDPVARTDARVVRIVVRLDEASTGRAARYTGLEVVGRIDVGAAP